MTRPLNLTHDELQKLVVSALRPTIYEVHNGFRLDETVYPNLHDAIVAAGNEYTFIPYPRT